MNAISPTKRIREKFILLALADGNTAVPFQIGAFITGKGLFNIRIVNIRRQDNWSLIKVVKVIIE